MIRPPPTSTLFPYTTLFRSSPSSTGRAVRFWRGGCRTRWTSRSARSEEHTSELQSRGHLVCRLLLEKKKTLHVLHADQAVNVHHLHRVDWDVYDGRRRQHRR